MPQIILPTWSTHTGEPVTQPAHGFTVGTQLYFDGTNWARAQANNVNTLRLATVAQVIDGSRYLIAFEGVMNWPAHGLTSGARYYLSDTVPGGISLTVPNAPSTYEQPVLVPLGPDHVRLLEYVLPDPSRFGTPTGTILAHASNTAPTGFLPCIGTAVSRSTYSNLFALIGTNWGAGDGSTTFNVPDLRDWYLRGCSTTNTPGTVFQQSTARPTTAFSGSAASNGNHNHDYYLAASYTGTGDSHPSVGATTNFYANKTSTAGAHTHTVTINGGGDAETRPRSKHVLYVIKF